jgi:sulfatase modifying factor 1
MRLHSISLWIASVILCSGASAQTPPTSLDGNSYAFIPNAPYQVSVPLQYEFGSSTFDEGFSDSLLADDLPYTYADGVITFYGGEEKIDLTFTSATEGTYQLSEREWDGDLGEYVWVEDGAGSFSEVSSNLALKSDWQHSATLDSELADGYWSVWQRISDSLSYDHTAGELSFVFADGGSSENGEYPEFELAYGRTLPMDADWQVVLDDISVSDSVEFFDIELDLEVAGTDFECELGFDDYGSGREVSVYILNDSGYGRASVSADGDAAIAYSLNLRVVHLASSRDLVFEYQPDGASGWTELARLNLGNGAFSGANASGWEISGELVSATQRMVLDVEVEASQATQLSDLEIGGIEIGSYTPPPTSLDGKSYAFSPSAPYQVSVPLQAEFGSSTFDEGFSDSLLADDLPYTYADGVITFYGGEEKIDLTFTSATEGTYLLSELEWDEALQADVWFEDEAGSFSEVSSSLALKSDWQHSATMDSELADGYWSVWQRISDSLSYDHTAGELSFVFADGGDPANGDYPEFELAYGRTLPMDADWQVVLDDIYVSDSVLEGFDIELNLEVAGTDFECELGFNGLGSVRGVSLSIMNDSGYNFDFVGSELVADIKNSLSLRIAHAASSRELVFEYQPDGASGWVEMARLDLANGAFTGSNVSGDGLSGELVSTSQRMVLDVGVVAFQATQLSDLEIGGIEIGSYTPAPTPIDSDGDGLDDSAETNTGVYVSASDTGTDPNNADSSGDGISDGEAVAAGVDPNTSYSGLLALVIAEPERFAADVLELRVGAEIAAVSNEAALLQIVLEESADLSTWSERDIIDVEVPLQAGETTKFFRYAMRGGAQSSTFPVPADADNFALIPAGEFTMGDALDGISNEPQHTVNVSGFYMGKHEVSWSLWQEVRDWAVLNGYSDLSGVGSGKGDEHPVDSVSWYDVVKWCNAASERAGLEPVYYLSGAVYRSGESTPDIDYSKQGYRLPTEAEWEKAARGGLSGKRFPWGDTIDHSYANYYEYTSYSYDSGDGSGYHPSYVDGDTPYTAPVGSFAANGYGLYDMSGNVWEWCNDWYDSSYYSSSPETDPQGPSTGSSRVQRGGGWNSLALNCRVALRSLNIPDGRSNGFGFRLALSE